MEFLHPSKKVISVGFTGSRIGMTNSQKSWLSLILGEYADYDFFEGEKKFFHHGCCVGSDEQAHYGALALGYRVVGYPSNLGPKYTAAIFKEDFFTLWSPDNPLARNIRIVEASTFLIAAPRTGSKGTWHAYNYAINISKPVVLLFQNGDAEFTNSMGKSVMFKS